MAVIVAPRPWALGAAAAPAPALPPAVAVVDNAAVAAGAQYLRMVTTRAKKRRREGLAAADDDAAVREAAQYNLEVQMRMYGDSAVAHALENVVGLGAGGAARRTRVARAMECVLLVPPAAGMVPYINDRAWHAAARSEMAMILFMRSGGVQLLQLRLLRRRQRLRRRRRQRLLRLLLLLLHPLPRLPPHRT